jgi:hypothetical protein
MKRLFTILAILIIFAISLAATPATVTSLHGRWKLLYRGPYGYEFRFYKNYRAVCILYLKTNALIFKGVYTMEDEGTLRINLYEMKNETRVYHPDTRRGFTKIKSSHFTFKTEIKGSGKNSTLVLDPGSIVIDGNTCDGYFEPGIRLKKIR